MIFRLLCALFFLSSSAVIASPLMADDECSGRDRMLMHSDQQVLSISTASLSNPHSVFAPQIEHPLLIVSTALWFVRWLTASREPAPRRLTMALLYKSLRLTSTYHQVRPG